EATSGTLLDVFAQNDGSNDLNRPEGLVFGPDRNLYITSFRANAFDTDKVIEFAGPGQPTPGAYIGKIDLAQPEALGGQRAAAQALILGRGGGLYVPITGGDKQLTGEIRRYDMGTGTYVVFAPPAHNGMPWSRVFGRSNPATLVYEP